MPEEVKQKTRITFDKAYQTLNPEQREAVDAIEGPVMVLAGPGTGKTQVLAMRVANILKQTQMDPWNILCLTFTESAAVNMRQRLLQIIGEAAYQVRIHTFHSFGNDVIQEFPEKFALAREWQVLSDVERVEMWRDLLESLPGTSPLKPFGAPLLYLPDVISAVQTLKKEGVGEASLKKLLGGIEEFIKLVDQVVNDFIGLKPPDRSEAKCQQQYDAMAKLVKGQAKLEVVWMPFKQLFDDWQDRSKVAESERQLSKLRTSLKNNIKKMYGGLVNQLPKQQDLAKLYAKYQQQLIADGRYDYEDMIMQVITQWQEDDEMLAYYQEQWQYVLVDEYQDTNGSQNEIVRLLGSFDDSPNIFVVGDDKQSIFRWQGASLENLMSFYERYSGSVKVVSLKLNYRSQQTVLDAAEAVIANNTESVARYLPDIGNDLAAASRREAQALQHFVLETVAEEDYFIGQKISELLASGVDPDQIAVLYRFNRDGTSLLNVLLKLGVPVRLEAGEDVLAEPRVRQLLTLLEYVVSEREEILAEVLHYDWLGLPALDVLKITHWAGQNRESLFDVLASDEKLKAAGVEDTAKLAQLLLKIAEWRVVSHNYTLQHLVDVVMKESGLLNQVLADDSQLPTLTKMTALFNEIKKLNQANPALTLAEFVSRIKLLRENGLPLKAERLQTARQAVRLMTAHKAKGLEFEHVFIMRATAKHWGNLRVRNRLALPHGLIEHDPVVGQANNEDERRLFYVALTRAKQMVYLTQARLNEAGREQVPSVFLHEMSGAWLKQIEPTESEAAVWQRLSLIGQPEQKNQAADVKSWLQDKLLQYTMSVTHLNNYLECPRLWYYRNLLRVPAAPTKPLVFGTVVHNALRDYGAQINEKQQPDVEYLIKQFEKYVKRELLTDSEKKDMRQLGQQVLATYYDKYHSEMSEQALLEYDFRKHGVVVADLPLTGKIDKIQFPKEGKEVVVVDYKTGNPDNVGAKMRAGGAYSRQLVFYKLLGDMSEQFEYDITSGQLDFIQASRRTGKFVRKNYEISDEDVEELKQVISKTWEEIKALKFLDEEGYCGECEYCRVGR